MGLSPAQEEAQKGYGWPGEEERNGSLPIADNAIIAARRCLLPGIYFRPGLIGL